MQLTCMNFTPRVEWRGLEIGGGNWIQNKSVYWIFRCQPIWVGISAIIRVPEYFGEMTNSKTNDLNELAENACLLHLADVVKPLHSTRGVPKGRCLATLLLRTTRMRSEQRGGFNNVVSLRTNKQDSWSNKHTAQPYESYKIVQGQPHIFANWELVLNWYKSFPPAHVSQAKTNDSTTLSIKTSTT